MKSRDKRCFALRENYLEFPGIDNAIDNVAYLSIYIKKKDFYKG